MRTHVHSSSRSDSHCRRNNGEVFNLETTVTNWASSLVIAGARKIANHSICSKKTHLNSVYLLHIVYMVYAVRNCGLPQKEGEEVAGCGPIA